MLEVIRFKNNILYCDVLINTDIRDAIKEAISYIIFYDHVMMVIFTFNNVKVIITELLEEEEIYQNYVKLCYNL